MDALSCVGDGWEWWSKSGGREAWTAKAGHDCWDVWAQQVMTAGTYGPSGQLIFVIVTPHSIVCEAALLRSSSELAPQLHVAAWVR